MTIITGDSYVEAPTTWTEHIYDLSAYNNQDVFIAIQCVSDNAIAFFVDDFVVYSVGGYVDNDDSISPIANVALVGNYPNPFNSHTMIKYAIKESAPVKIEIYNLKGQLVNILVNETKAAGTYTFDWNGLDKHSQRVSSGIYYCKMTSGSFSSTSKMIMLK